MPYMTKPSHLMNRNVSRFFCSATTDQGLKGL